MRSRPGAILNNTSFVFILGIVVGVAAGGGASWIEPALVPVLAGMMTISILDISSRIFLDSRRTLVPVLAALSLNYLVLSGLFLGLSSLIIDDADLHTGFVVLAAVPAAAGIIPVTYILGGNTRLSLQAVVALFIMALAAAPLICVLCLGSSVIGPVKLLTILGEVIVAPIIVSRVLRRTRLAPAVLKWRNLAVNWGMFLLIYTIVGANRNAFFEDLATVLVIAAIVFVTSFVLGEVIRRVGRSMGMKKADIVSFMMLGSKKDVGLAAAIALVFFGPVAALPAAVSAVVNSFHFVFLAWAVKRMR